MALLGSLKTKELSFQCGPTFSSNTSCQKVFFFKAPKVTSSSDPKKNDQPHEASEVLDHVEFTPATPPNNFFP